MRGYWLGVAVVLIALALWLLLVNQRHDFAALEARPAAPPGASVADDVLAAPVAVAAEREAAPVQVVGVERDDPLARWKAKRCTLSGRLLDSQLQPLPYVEMSYARSIEFDTESLSAPEFTPSNDCGRTDAKGVFEMWLSRDVHGPVEAPTPASPGALRQALHLYARTSGYTVHKRLELSDEKLSTDWPIGDWIVPAERSIARASVIATDGEPLAFEDVDVEVRFDGESIEARAGRLRWDESGDDWELFALQPPERLELRAKLGWNAPTDWITVAPLGSRVELRVARGGIARGSVVVDEDVGAPRVRVQVGSRDYPELAIPDEGLRVAPLDETRGEWTIAGLPPGRWTARFVHTLDGTRLAELELPAIRSGETSDAGELDLRGALVRWAIELASVSAGAIERGVVAHVGVDELESDGERATWCRTTVGYGRALLRTPIARRRVIAWASGFRPAVLDVAAAPCTIRLDPAWDGWISLEGGASGPAWSPEWLDAPAGWAALRATIATPTNGARTHASFPGPGRYRLRSIRGDWIGAEFTVPEGGPTTEIVIRP